MDIEAIRLLAAVARRGSFAGVARDAGLEPSSVSRIVAALEAELGFRVFQRTTRRMSLTEAGEIFLRGASGAAERIGGARDDARAVTDGPSGHLRLTASVAYGTVRLVPLLPAFRAAYPRVTVELALTDANLDLVAERIDLAVRLAPSVSGDVVATRLAATRYHVCAAPAYLVAHGAPVTPAELGRHRCLQLAFPDYRSVWRFKQADGVVEAVTVGGDVIISNALALREAALLGLGPALLADWLVESALAGRALVDLFPHMHAAAADFDTAAWLLYPSREHVPAKVRVAIDFLRRHLGRGRP